MQGKVNTTDCAGMDATTTAQSPPQKKQKKKMKRRGPRLTGVSRQRRLANTRERHRVQTLNTYIETLRTLIPLSPDEKKPSKTETVRLAALYIEHMTEILQTTKKPASISDVSSIGVEDDLDDIDTDFTLSDFGLDELPTDCLDFDVQDLFWDTDF